MTARIRTIVLVSAAAMLASALPAHSADPFGGTPCSGVRPGALIEAPRGIDYTMGFLFEGTDAQGAKANYVTTIGNFVLDAAGAKTWPGGRGPTALDAAGKVVGRFVYASLTETPEFSTFGLIRLERNVKASGEVCHFGGPTGTHTDSSPAPLMVEYYGHGVPPTPARTAMATGGDSEDTLLMQGLYGVLGRDEGAPVLTDGMAVGYLDGGIGAGTGGGGGFVIRRIGPPVAQAQRALGITLKLITARTN